MPEAVQGYRDAINHTNKRGFLHSEAISCELAGKYWLSQEDEDMAGFYIKKARELFSRWGAHAKVADMTRYYSRLLETRESSLKAGAHSETNQIPLDLNTVIKASQAIAGEIELKRLLANMMRIVIENAGAQKGFLILEKGGQWVIEAEGGIDSSEISVLHSQDIELNDAVSTGIVNYVARTQDNVVLDNAVNAGDFTGDERIQQSQAKSVLCTPLINQGKVSGILYLENNLVVGAFTSERVELLNLLSSQMAMALDNAQLYANLEERVEERTQELQAANQAKSIFLANMSHELRTPLNAILGFTRLLFRDEDLSAQQHEQIRIINRSGEHLLDMVGDILTLSRIEAGRVRLSEETFDFRQTLEDIERIFRSHAEGKGLRFSLELADDLPPYLRGDSGKLRQVLINLLDNAVKYTQEGTVDLRTRTETMAEDPERVMLQLEVEDTGVGIPQDKLDEIFETFFRMEQTQQTQAGAGLGLSISKSLVDMMGGEITLESEVGRGSLFTVSIPMLLTDEEAAPSDETSALEVIELKPGQQDWRILVVDDNRENLLLLTDLLAQVGFSLQEAESGAEAVAKFKEWRPDFIWMDVRMPDIDGYEATKQIHALPGGEKVKIVAVTASVIEDRQQIIQDTGVDDVVLKPFRDQEIFDVMARELGVEYLYRDRKEAPEQPEEIELSAEMLADLPPELLQALNRTTLVADREATIAVIERIEEDAPECAASLRALVESYQMGRLRDLMKEAETKNDS